MPESNDKPEVPRSQSKEKPEVPRSQSNEITKSAITPKLVAMAALIGIAASLLTWALTGDAKRTTTKLTREESSATSEAISFATSESIRIATKVIADATRTVGAQVTSTEDARAYNAVSSRTAAAMIARARLTAQAPATQTAQAQEFATMRSQAEGTIGMLEKKSEMLAGPESGAIDQPQGGNLACSSPHATSGNFALEVTFQNPKPKQQTAPRAAWDYGVIFAHPNDELQYRMILDSSGVWTLNLHTNGYDISNRDTTPVLDTTESSENKLKLYVVGETAQLFINDNFIATLDLTMFEQGLGASGGYDVALCAGIKDESEAPGQGTLYSGYTLWSVP